MGWPVRKLCQIAGCQGQHALGDPDCDALEGFGAVLLEVELTFEGVGDRLDQLAYRLDHRLTEARGLVFMEGTAG